MYPVYYNMPTMASTEVAINVAKEFTNALLHPEPAVPYQVGKEFIEQLKKLSEIFTNVLPKQ